MFFFFLHEQSRVFSFDALKVQAKQKNRKENMLHNLSTVQSGLI